jgi:hypothetical protein
METRETSLNAAYGSRASSTNDREIKKVENSNGVPSSHNTTYTLRANALAFRDIAPFGRNVVYAGTVSRHSFNRM